MSLNCISSSSPETTHGPIMPIYRPKTEWLRAEVETQFPSCDWIFNYSCCQQNWRLMCWGFLQPEWSQFVKLDLCLIPLTPLALFPETEPRPCLAMPWKLMSAIFQILKKIYWSKIQNLLEMSFKNNNNKKKDIFTHAKAERIHH